MKRWLLLACLLCGTANAADIVLTERDVTLADYGTVTVGDKVDKMERVLRQPLPSSPDRTVCLIATPKGELTTTGISFLIEDKHLTRINVDYYDRSPEPLTIKTPAGIGLGTSEEDVMKAYAGHVRVEPDSGDPSWHYIYVDAPDGQTGLRFDTDGKKVKSMHAGGYPALSYKQGCY